MKSKLLLLAALALILASCAKTDDAAVQTSHAASQSRTLTAAMPADNTNTRLALTETTEGNISVKWKAGDVINLCFVSGQTIKTVSNVPVTNIREDGKKADFAFTLPQGITEPYDLYGIYGATLTQDTKEALFPAPPAGTALSDSEPLCVMRFAATGLTATTPLSVSFNHLGALLGVTFTNATASDYTVSNLAIASSGYNWLYNAAGQATYDIAAGTFTDNKAGSTIDFGATNVSIPANGSAKIYRWFVPTAAPDITKTMTAAINGTTMAQTLPAKAFDAGKYYKLSLFWDGTVWKYGQMPPATNLIAHWNFNGNANDVSGNNRHGTVYNATLTAGRKGNANGAYYFNGTDAYIDLGAWENGGAMSFSFWARWDVFNNWGLLMDLGNGRQDNNIAIGNAWAGSNLLIDLFDGSTQYDRYCNNILSLNNWIMLVVTIDGTGVIKTYKNGQLFCTITNNSFVPKTMLRTKQFLGKTNWPENGLFRGAMDDVRIYNKALSQAEVTALYYYE